VMIRLVKEVGKMCVLGHVGLVVPGRGVLDSASKII